MPRYARTLFGVKNVEAVDIDDPVSFGTRERTSTRSRKEKDGALLTSHRNGCCVECRKLRTQCGAEKRAGLRSPATTTLLENDFHGFRWIDNKQNKYQSLNVSGKGVIATTDVHRSDIGFPDDRLVLPDIAVVESCLVTGQMRFSKRRRPGRRRKRRDSFELVQEGAGDCGFLKPSWNERERIKKDRKDCGYLEQGSWDEREKIQKHDEDCGFSNVKPLEDRRKDKDPRKKIFINVILPKITS